MKVLCAFVVLCMVISSAFSDAVTITTPTTIDCGNTSYEGFDVTISGCAVTMSCQHSFNSLRLINGATLSHLAGDTNGVYATIAHNLSVDATSQINAVGRGFSPHTGPGAGQTTDAYGSGGGHAGWGGQATVVASGGVPYGSISTPLTLGSGGGASGGFGGGLIHLVVGDTLSALGGIWANGGSCSNTAGAGSGGSIYITTAVLAGTGTITATGGAAQSTGGGGSGGRIALYYGTRTFTGTISVCGGAGYQYGAAGTLYTKTISQTLGDLQVTNCNLLSTAVTLLSGLPACNVLISSHATTVLGDSVLTIAGNLHIGFSSQLWTAVGQHASVTVQHNVTIDSSGAFTAVGCGYPAGTGPGAGATVTSYGGGGGYGGTGGAGNGAAGGISYARLEGPQDFGSGGGGIYGAAGGGCLHLTVNDTLRVDGALAVDGAVASNLSGGGAGGSLYLDARVLTGRGSVTAQGGQAGSNGGGGGGGRLVFYYTSNLFTGTLSVCGGWGYHYGGAGLLYTKAASQTIGDLSINNCGHNGATTGLSSLTANSVTITSGGAGECVDSVITINGNVRVTSTGFLWGMTGSPLSFTVMGDLRIDSLGIFSALGRGYAKGTGPGAGATFGTYGGGGGHGGAGGTGTGGATGGGTYDAVAQPIQMGSGGGASAGAAGGGAILLTVSDTLFLNDSLTVDGGESGAFGGGGSGGSLYIRAPAILGNGYITANGGNGNVGGGGGGGGRIAIYTCSRTVPTNHITANTGSSQHPGSAGTIYLGSNDCNHNGHADGCDILTGTSSDCNNNGVPDECENITSPVLTVYGGDGQLSLRWTCVPGYTQYHVYGKQASSGEILLTTTSSLSFDASYLLSGTNPQRWAFRVVGWTP